MAAAAEHDHDHSKHAAAVLENEDVDPEDDELLPAGHGRQTASDDEDELSTKDPAGQVEASAQFVAQMHG